MYYVCFFCKLTWHIKLQKKELKLVRLWVYIYKTHLDTCVFQKKHEGCWWLLHVFRVVFSIITQTVRIFYLQSLKWRFPLYTLKPSNHNIWILCKYRFSYISHFFLIYIKRKLKDLKCIHTLSTFSPARYDKIFNSTYCDLDQILT